MVASLPKLTKPESRILQRLSVLHPGYDTLLFTLPAYDTANEQPVVSHDVVKAACVVVTNGAPGFLATDIAGQHPIADEVSQVNAGSYYWHLAASPGPVEYKIVCRFPSWTFPKTIPEPWPRSLFPGVQDFGRTKSTMSDAVKEQDAVCIVTQYGASLENAHIVPRDEKAWFWAYRMDQYIIVPTSGVDDVANGVCLRADVHACFDRSGFVFFPCGEDNYLAYVIDEREGHYAALFHRRLVNMHQRVPGALLYARFALAIINRVPQEVWDTPSHSFPIPEKVRNREKARETTVGDVSMGDHEPALEESNADCPAPTTVQSPGHITAPSATDDSDEEYKELLMTRFPALQNLPEVEDPPDFPQTTGHIDVPRFRRLRAGYIKKCPQVRQVSGPTASEADAKRWENIPDDGLEESQPPMRESSCALASES